MPYDKKDHRVLYSLKNRILKIDSALDLRRLLMRHKTSIVLHKEAIEAFKEKIDELRWGNRGDNLRTDILNDCTDTLEEIIENYSLLSDEEKRILRNEDNDTNYFNSTFV